MPSSTARQRSPLTRLVAAVVPVPLLLAAVLLQAPSPASAAIIGAELHNVSSDTTQFSYVGRWRSDTEDGVYQAYSNDTDAVVTFSFVGVGASYLAEKRDDRGICSIQVDDQYPTYMDLYDNSGYSQGLQPIWSSGTLVYGQHNITISQVGPDSRFGYYPYLVTSTWLEAVPSDVASYLNTQVIPSSTASSIPTQSSSSSPNVGAIVGGTIGAVLAAMLLGFLFYLYWRDRTQRKRSEGAPVEKVKKADGKMAIEDEPESSPYGGAPYPGWGAGFSGYGYPHDPYGAYSSGGAYTPYGYDPSSAAGSAWGGYAPPHHPQHAHQGGGGGGGYLGAPLSADSRSADSHSAPAPRASGGASSSGGAYPASAARGSNYDSAYHSGDGSDSRSYPYHVQGFGTESRSYPVPEI
ncbi:hypothetical protein JCM3775_007031 [Rhodotorula graminis]